MRGCGSLLRGAAISSLLFGNAPPASSEGRGATA